MIVGDLNQQLIFTVVLADGASIGVKLGPLYRDPAWIYNLCQIVIHIVGVGPELPQKIHRLDQIPVGVVGETHRAECVVFDVFEPALRVVFEEQVA